MSNKDDYDILGVSPNASPKEIKSAYKKRILTAHPDKGGSEQEMSDLNGAYGRLKNKPQPLKNEVSTHVEKSSAPAKAKHKRDFSGFWKSVGKFFGFIWAGITVICIGIGRSFKWIWDKFAEISWDAKYKKWFWKSFPVKMMWILFIVDWIGALVLIVITFLSAYGDIKILTGSVGYTTLGFAIVLFVSLITLICNKCLDLKLWRYAFAKKKYLNGKFETKTDKLRRKANKNKTITTEQAIKEMNTEQDIERLEKQNKDLRATVQMLKEHGTGTVNIHNENNMNYNKTDEDK